MSKCKNIIRKIKRNSSAMNKKADFLQVSYFNFSEGAHVLWRKRKYSETTPKQKRLNTKRAKRYFESIVEANFKSHRDFYITLTFSNENYPADEKAAHRAVKNWIARLNYKRKKKGMDSCKYIIVFEMSKTGRMHFHILMDGILDRDTVEDEWKLGRCNTQRLKADPVQGLKDLICYLSKDFDTEPVKKAGRKSKKGDAEADEVVESMAKKKWISSKGLIRPWISPVKSTKISQKRFNLMKEMPADCEAIEQTIMQDNPGYIVLSIEKDYSEETGQWYIFARLRSVESIRQCGESIVHGNTFERSLKEIIGIERGYME